jgi:hypothetical protein
MLANPTFYLKMGFVLVAVLLMRAIKSSVFGVPALGAGIASAKARRLAAASLVCWAAAIVAGRLTAYPGLVASWFTLGPAVGVT